MPLTDSAIRNVKPRQKPYKLSDAGGLFLLVTPSGGKWWRLKYRFGGKEKQLSLGVYPDVKLTAARVGRADARALLAASIDPSENRKARKTAQSERAANSFEIVAREWFVSRVPGWSATHADKTMSRLTVHLFPWFGGRPIADIAAPDLLAVVRRAERRGLSTAHRVLGLAGQVFRYAVATGRCERDPSGDLRGALPPVKAKHFAAITDPKRLANILRAIDAYQGTVVVCAALRLAPLVFVRPGELRRMQWADIDTEASEWRYTVTKTDTPHIVPLSRQALAVVEEIRPLTGRGIHVFTNPRAPKGDRPMSENALSVALKTLGLVEITAHGFRATARTILSEVLHFEPEWIERQLAHKTKALNGRAYDRAQFLPERRKMMQQWADYLDKLKDGAEVIPLPQRG